MKRKLIMLGAGETAEVMYEYFTYDSDYEVVAFSVDRDYIKQNKLHGLDVVAFEELPYMFAPEEYSFFAAVSYTKLNRARTDMYAKAKAMGYAPASYISSKASVMPSAKIGEHVFIFENNVIQPFVTIGDNVIMWSGNHIGHRAKIGNNCFLSSHVVVAGFAEIGDNSFIGVNSSIADYVAVGADCFIGAGSIISSNIQADSVTRPAKTQCIAGAKLFNKIKEQ